MIMPKRADTRYRCTLCPDGKTFDRLKKGAITSWRSALEYHVEIVHPEHSHDWMSLKGEKVAATRAWARREDETQDQRLGSVNQPNEVFEDAEDEDLEVDGTVITQPAKPQSRGRRPARPAPKRLGAVLPTGQPANPPTMPQYVNFEADEQDEEILEGLWGPALQEMAIKVFPEENIDNSENEGQPRVKIPSSRIVLYLLAKVRRLQDICEEAAVTNQRLEERLDERQEPSRGVAEGVAAEAEAQGPEDVPSAKRPRKRGRESVDDAEDEEETLMVVKKPRSSLDQKASKS